MACVRKLTINHPSHFRFYYNSSPCKKAITPPNHTFSFIIYTAHVRQQLLPPPIIPPVLYQQPMLESNQPSIIPSVYYISSSCNKEINLIPPFLLYKQSMSESYMKIAHVIKKSTPSYYYFYYTSSLYNKATQLY